MKKNTSQNYRIKMKSYFTIAFSIIFLTNVHAKDIISFYHDIHIADSLYQNNELHNACLQYEKTLETVSFVHSRVLRKVLKVSKEANYKPLIKKCKILIKSQKKCPSGNTEILELVNSISKMDQKVRSNKYFKASKYFYSHIEDTLCHNTTKYQKSKELVADWLRTDSTNILKAIQLIDRYGYLGEQELGSRHYIKFQVLLLHFDRDTNNTILKPILEKALKKNKITPFVYTYIIDRHLYNTSKTQKYWTWPLIDSDPKLSQNEINEILNLRKGIGMFGTDYKVSCYRERWVLNNISGTTY